MDFFRALIHSDEVTADSIIVGGLTALGALIVYQGYAMALGGAAMFNPLTFSTGAGALITAIGGARRLRDGGGSAPVSAQPSSQ